MRWRRIIDNSVSGNKYIEMSSRCICAVCLRLPIVLTYGAVVWLLREALVCVKGYLGSGAVSVGSICDREAHLTASL